MVFVLSIDKFVHHPFAVLYQADLAFPGYGHDAPSFHWKYDSVVESLIRNNPPSSRRSKVNHTVEKSEPEAAPGPQIGHCLLTRAQRKDIKKVHVPKGIVMQYEGELVSFLDQLTLSDEDEEGDKDELVETEKTESMADADPRQQQQEQDVDADLSNWVVVEKTVLVETQPESIKATVAETVETTFSIDAVAKEVKEDEEDRPQVYLRWDIQDQFLRFVAHALCSFYGLVSFSKTAKDGKRWMYICHPNHLDSIGELTSAPLPTADIAMRPQGPHRQKTLEHVQDLAVHELELLWNRIEPTKLMSKSCPRPDMTFFEYLYPATRPVF
ncbi:hypothetical protein FBU30_001389 [Linnemannia zychae]|nr:hypothetical protein FBU30_001389 [Linnemannia zychae]